MKINKKVIIYSISILIISTVIFAAYIVNINNKYTSTSNQYIANIVKVLKSNYPNISEEEILEILNNEELSGENIFEDYGYINNTNYIKELDTQLNDYLVIGIVLIISINLLWLGTICLNKKKQDKNIEELITYFKDLNENRYKLDIIENDEKMFSKLKNEIYKTTILLKELAYQNEKEKTDLSNTLADISHQIRTPITSIGIMINNIIDNPNMEKELKDEFIKDISKQIDWIASLSVALLKLAKVDAGTIKIEKKKVSVNELIENVISNLAIMIEVKNINIVKDIRTKNNEDIFYDLDYKWQLEAISNILKNAIEYSDNNSNIYITVQKSEVFLKINIKDEGKGINPKDIKNIFKRFYKGQNASDSSIGIGLALSKALIEKNDGTIKVKSKENSGTEFEIKYL